MSITWVAYLHIWKHLTGTNIVRLHNKLAETLHVVPMVNSISWYVAITISCRFSLKNRYKFHQCLWIVVNHSERIMGLILIKVVLLFFSCFVHRHGNPNTDRIERSIYFKMTLTSHVPHTSRKKIRSLDMWSNRKMYLKKNRNRNNRKIRLVLWCRWSRKHYFRFLAWFHPEQWDRDCLFMNERPVGCVVQHAKQRIAKSLWNKYTIEMWKIVSNHYKCDGKPLFKIHFFHLLRSFFYRTFLLIFFLLFIAWISYNSVSNAHCILWKHFNAFDIELVTEWWQQVFVISNAVTKTEISPFIFKFKEKKKVDR